MFSSVTSLKEQNSRLWVKVLSQPQLYINDNKRLNVTLEMAIKHAKKVSVNVLMAGLMNRRKNALPTASKLCFGNL